jgi:hypothetical protein
MTKALRILLVLGAVAGLVAGIAWYSYPTRRIARELDALPLPADLRLSNEVVTDNGRLCIDECSYADRYYVTTRPPYETAAAIERELVRAGYQTTSITGCRYDGCRYDPWGAQPYEVTTTVWTQNFQGHGMVGMVRVGRRADGRRGVEISLGP